MASDALTDEELDALESDGLTDAQIAALGDEDKSDEALVLRSVAPQKSNGFWSGWAGGILNAAPESWKPRPLEGVAHGVLASEGAGEGVLEMAKEATPGGRYFLPKGGIEEAGKILDYPLMAAGGLAGGAMEMARPILGPLGVMSRGVQGAGRELGALTAGTPADPRREEAIRNYVITGEPNEYVGPYTPPSGGESTTANLAMGLGTDIANAPFETMAMAGLPKVLRGAPKAVKDVTPLETGKTPKEIKLLRGAIKPQPGTKFARNFDESGSNGLRLISEEAPQKGGDSFSRLDAGAEKAIEKLGKQRETMMIIAEAANKEGSGKSIKQAVSRLGDDSYYTYLDPEGAQFFKEKAASIPDGPIPVREMQAIYTTVENMIRKARKASGDAEAALEANDKFQALEAIRENVGKQINELVSREPNEYLENSRNFSDVYRVLDRAQYAEDLFRNDPSNTFTWRDLGNFQGWASFLKKVGMKRTSETDLSSALKGAQRKGLPAPAPLQEQKPSTLPTVPRKPTALPFFGELTPEQMQVLGQPETLRAILTEFPSLREELKIPESKPPTLEPWTIKPEAAAPPIETIRTPGGMSAEAPPVKALPRWISDVQKATRDPVDMMRDMELVNKVVTGKGKITMAEVMKDPATSKWAKNVIQRLAENPEQAQAYMQELYDAVRAKVEFPRAQQ